jgi:serine/threonine-protein kinase
VTSPAPRVVGRYLLCESIASGGMATVHLGRLMGPEGFSRTVAIKQLHPQYARDPEFIAMFLDEARLAARVRHPNVVSPLDVVVDPPELFIVMDYVHGESLARLLRRSESRPVPPRVAASIMGQVLLGLHAAHEATGESGEPLGIVHRDVSPQNILVSADGVARVVDFGIAKATNRAHKTESGKLKGKLGYMSPEQVQFEPTDRRADVFAAGVVLWEMLTGQRLFVADNPANAVQAILHSPIPPPSKVVPDLDPRLDDVLACALSRDANGRFENARAMAVALETIVPPSSMLEVGAWVEQLSGAELKRRADRVADVEATSCEDLTKALPRGALLGLAGPLPDGAPASGREPVKDSVGPTEVSIAVPFENERRAKRFRVAVLIAAALGAVSTIVVLQTRAVDEQPPIVQGLGPLPVAAAAPAAAVLNVEPVASLPAAAAPAGSGQHEAPRAARAAARSVPPEDEPAQKDPRAPEASGKSPAPRSKSANCDVPYTINKQGVKRFKLECF